MSFLDTVKGWFGKAKDATGDVVEKAGDVAEAGWKKTKEVASDAAEAVGDKVDDLRGKDDDGGKPGGDWDDKKDTGSETSGGD